MSSKELNITDTNLTLNTWLDYCNKFNLSSPHTYTANKSVKCVEVCRQLVLSAFIWKKLIDVDDILCHIARL